MDIFFWVVGALLVGLGGFTSYTNWKLYFDSRKAKQEFKANHQDVQVYHSGNLRCWLFLIMLAACLGFGVTLLVLPENPGLTVDNRYAQVLVYFGLAVFAFAMYGEALTDNEILYTPEGFLYETEVIRYKAIRTVNVQKGMFKNSTLSLSSGKDLTINKSLALWISQQWQDWKENHKPEFTTRKERRAAARAKRAAK